MILRTFTVRSSTAGRAIIDPGGLDLPLMGRTSIPTGARVAVALDGRQGIILGPVRDAAGSPIPDPGGGGGTSDHGALNGLADDDHPQYLLASAGGLVPPGPSVWSNYSAVTNEISATAWAAFGPALSIPAQPLGTRIVIAQHAWLVAATVAGDIRCTVGISGGASATPGSPTGHHLYKLFGGPSTEQLSITLAFTVTDDSLPISVQTYGQQSGRNGPGQRQINFIGLTAWRAL